MKKLIILTGILFIFANLSVMAQLTKEKDWWVRVKLKNGSKIEGAVLADRFVEKAAHGRIYQKVEEENFRMIKGTGIRIYYVKDEPGFVFLPYRQVGNVVILHRLTQKQKIKIQEKIRYTRMARAEEVNTEKKLRREAMLKRAGVALTLEEEKKQKEQVKKDQQDMLEGIVVKKEEVLKRMLPVDRRYIETFPPGPVWNKENYKTWNSRRNRSRNAVRIRIITLPDGTKRRVAQRPQGRSGGLPPDKIKFINNFASWQRAVAEYKRQEMLLKQEMAQKLLEEKNKKEKKPVTLVKTTPDTKKTIKTIPQTRRKRPKVKISDALNVILYANSSEEKLKAVQALGNYGGKAYESTQAISALALDDRNSAVRKAAIHALGDIQKPHEIVLPTLMDILELSGDVALRREASGALQKIKDLTALKAYQDKNESLSLALENEDDKIIKYRILRIFEKLGEKKYIDDVKPYANDDAPAVQVAACSALIEMVSKKKNLYSEWVYQPLLNGLFDKDPDICIVAAQALARLDSPDTYPKIEKAMQDERMDANTRKILQPVIAKWLDEDKSEKDKGEKSQTQPDEDGEDEFDEFDEFDESLDDFQD